jgi:hypothetical protein
VKLLDRGEIPISFGFQPFNPWVYSYKSSNPHPEIDCGFCTSVGRAKPAMSPIYIMRIADVKESLEYQTLFA